MVPTAASKGDHEHVHEAGEGVLTSIGLIALAMLAAPLLTRPLDDRAGWILALAPLSVFAYFVTLVPEVAQGGVITQSVTWVGALGIELSFF